MPLLPPALFALALSSWTVLPAPVNESLRGLSAASPKVVWASGTHGTWLRSVDGGEHWTVGKVAGGESLDFRDVHAVSDRVAVLMSAGPGAASRIYRTDDGGRSWQLTFTNLDEKGFFDAIAFSDARRGVLLGDPVDGEFAVFTTDDGGRTWTRRRTPPALAGEGAFAASGTCLVVAGRRAWFGTGGARVFRSEDGGATWSVSPAAPLRHDSPSAGIFSLGLAGQRGIIIAAGGDYRQPRETAGNAAISEDGGRSWRPLTGLPGYLSAVVYWPARKSWIATGLNGTVESRDGGATWTAIDSGAYHSLAVAGEAVAAVGPAGRIARYHYPRRKVPTE